MKRLFVLIVVALIFVDAFTICCFWNWFVTPLGPFKRISLLNAFGLATFLGVFRNRQVQAAEKNEQDRRSLKERAVSEVFSIFTKYAFAWVSAIVIRTLQRVG